MQSFSEFLTEDIELLIENEGRVNFFGVDHLGADVAEIKKAVERVQSKTSNLKGRIIFKDGAKHINVYQLDSEGHETYLGGFNKGHMKSGTQGPIIRKIETALFGETYPQRMSRLRRERSSRLTTAIPTPDSVQSLEDRLTLLRGLPRKEGSDRTKRVDDSIRRIQTRLEKAKTSVSAAMTPAKPTQTPTPRRAFTSKDVLTAIGMGTFATALGNVWDAAGALVAQPSIQDRMTAEEDAQTDLGLGFNLGPDGELEADPAGFKAVRDRQKRGENYPPTLFPR